MDRSAAELALSLLGVTSAVLLVAYGLLSSAVPPGADPLFWLLTIAFLVYVAWDVRRHIRGMRRHAAAKDAKGP